MSFKARFKRMGVVTSLREEKNYFGIYRSIKRTTYLWSGGFVKRGKITTEGRLGWKFK